MNFTHNELCVIGAKWLQTSCRVKCPVVFAELVSSSGEHPDVIGFNNTFSVLIEVKTTRSDFHADKKKYFRQFPEQGMGDFRFYLCPQGILKPEDIPDKWGLIWVNEKRKCRVVKKIFDGNYDRTNQFEKNIRRERMMMYSALRRLTNWTDFILTSKKD